jgi:hypothetical protein
MVSNFPFHFLPVGMRRAGSSIPERIVRAVREPLLRPFGNLRTPLFRAGEATLRCTSVRYTSIEPIGGPIASSRDPVYVIVQAGAG